MATTPVNVTRWTARGTEIRWRRDSNRTWWSQHREVTLNWLALGLLLAAWNASDNDPTARSSRRPEILRGYSYVSVRAHRLASTK
jgi:hypothetical protein